MFGLISLIGGMIPFTVPSVPPFVIMAAKAGAGTVSPVIARSVMRTAAKTVAHESMKAAIRNSKNSDE